MRGKRGTVPSCKVFVAMDLRTCRFCADQVPSKHTVGLFTNQAALINLTTRFSTLLQLPVSSNDGLSKYCCRHCRDSLVNLERKLTDTRNRVRVVYQHAGIVTNTTMEVPKRDLGTLKRAKDTSGGPGVSPATAKARPPCKKTAVSRTLFPPGMTSKQLCTAHTKQL